MKFDSSRLIHVDVGKEFPIMWLPDPVAAIEFVAALLSAIAAALSIAHRVPPKGRDDQPGDDDA